MRIKRDLFNNQGLMLTIEFPYENVDWDSIKQSYEQFTIDEDGQKVYSNDLTWGEIQKEE